MQKTRGFVKYLCLGACLATLGCRKSPEDQTPGKPRGGAERAREAGKASQGKIARKPEPMVAMPDNHVLAYDIIANRASSVFYANGGLVVRCGGVGFVKYTDGGWKNPWILQQTIEVSEEDLSKDVPQISKPSRVLGARLQSLAGTLILPIHWNPHGIGGDSSGDLVLEALLHNRVKGQYLTPMVNGKTLKSIKLRAGLNRVRVQVSSDLVQKGDNVFRFVFRKSAIERGSPPVSGIIAGRGRREPGSNSRSAAAFLYVGLGPRGFELPENEQDLRWPVRDAEVDGKKRKVVVLAKESTLSHYVIPPSGAKLLVKVAAAESAQSKSKYSVQLTVDGSPTKSVAEGATGPNWESELVDLSEHAGQAVRLDFVSKDNSLRVGQATLHAVPEEEPVKWSKKQIDYVFIWVADTLRRDRVGAHGAKNAHTPSFDRFAKRSVVFEQATIQGNHSMTSHGSILSGFYPPVHGFERASRRMHKPLIYELFKKAGWRTSLFSSNGYISAKWGFNRGLDEYRNFIRESKANSSKYLWGTAKRYLKRHIKDKHFVYLATIDPHVTYDPPPDLLKLHFPEPYKGPVPRRATGRYLEKIITGAIELERQVDRRRLEALYRGEVSYNDRWFGKFMNDLEKLGIADRSMVVMLSDHGDQFWEHGSVGHGKSLYEEEIAVPLMIWWPGLPKKEFRVAGDVEIMDVYSTILDLVGITPAPEAQSGSLLPILRQARPRSMTCAFAYNYSKSRSIRMGRYKLILKRPGKVRLYDLEKDPTEQSSIAEQKPIALRLLRNVFSLKNAYLTQWQKSRWGTAADLNPQFYEDIAEPSPAPGQTANRPETRKGTEPPARPDRAKVPTRPIPVAPVARPQP